MGDTAQLWRRIVAWHERHTPHGRLLLAGPATLQQVESLEAIIGQRLPDDLKVSYLLHNGSTWLTIYGELMPLAAIERMWSMYRDWQVANGWGIGSDWVPDNIAGPIKPYWWGPLRIPFTDNGGGDPTMVDLDPAAGGTRGQVIRYNHEVGPCEVAAASFSGWLEKIAAGLESDEFVYNESEDQVVPRSWVE